MLDDRLGFSTHFDQQGSSPWWVPSNIMPLLVGTGCQWIRDDFNWGLAEPSPGNYVRSGVKPFWSAAQAAGLKTVAIINPNRNYPNPYDPVGMSNFCAWLAVQNLGINVMEVLNEPNNISAFQGTSGQSDLVTLTNAVRAAVHAANPAIPVIGLGSQGNQILAMLGLNPAPLMDGIVYHPYDPGDNVPEHVFEPPFTNYLLWVSTLRAATNLPIWETERNFSGGSEYQSAVWNARRYIISLGIGIEHSFFYTFTDTGSQSLMDSFQNPRQSYYVLQRIVKYLVPTTPSVSAVTVIPGASDTDVVDLYAYLFSSNSATIATVWLGNFNPNAGPNPGSYTVSFPVNNSVTAASLVVDTVRGIELPLSRWRNSTSGGVLSVFNFTIDDRPRLIIAR